MAQFHQRAMLTRRPQARKPATPKSNDEPSKPVVQSHGAEHLLDLQRRVGNQAVLRLMRQGALRPLTPSNALTPVQRAPDRPSRGDPKLAVTGGSGVITAVVAGAGQGHTIIYIERATGAWKLELGAASQEAITIEQADDADLMKLEGVSIKRSWSASNAKLDAALDKARDIKEHAQDYEYKFIGTGLPFAKKKAINCARFGEKILKAAGIDASSGLIFKTPMELATGKKKFVKPKAKRSAAPAPPPDRPEIPAMYDI